MKRVGMVIAIFFVILTSVNAQILIGKSASALGVGVYDESGKYTLTDFTLRLAAEVKTPVYDAMSFSVRAAYCTNEKNFMSFWFDQKVTESISMRAGYFGRPIAFLNRPNPISAGAHYEYSSTAQIPGSATGLLLSNTLKDGATYYGVYYNQAVRAAEFNLGGKYEAGDYKLSCGWFINNTQQGFAATVKHNLFAASFFHESEKIYSGYVEIFTGVIDPYINFIRDHRNEVDVDFEIGVTKSFSLDTYQKGANYLVGAGYNTVTKTGNFYFWLYIE